MEREFRRCVEDATGRGQTVFLSSHILSEVEDLCTRVGILRLGTLLEVATIDTLRGMYSAELELDFAGPPPPDLDGVAGVGGVVRTPTGLRITLTGPPGPVVSKVAGLPLTGIRSREASLEEIFLTYYGAGGGDRPAAEGAGADARPSSDGPA
jgi:ABC-2 type transport system ATP-binding protein